MTRLPTTGGDTDAWGTVLNDYLTQTAGRTALASSPAAGATAFDVAVPHHGLVADARIVIDAFTSQAEVRQITSVSSNTVNLSSGLTYAHAAGDQVFPFGNKTLPIGLWGMPTGSDDSSLIQTALDQCLPFNIALDGQDRVHTITKPIMVGSSFKMKNWWIKAGASFAPADTNNAMLMGFNGSTVAVVSADPSNERITTATAHNIPGDGIGVVFKGSSLPGGLTEGRFYYVKSRPTSTSLTVSETDGGAAVNITSTGTGTAYCEVYAANMKSFLDHVYLDGQLVTGINGILVSVQQQGHWINVRVDNCDGFGVKMKGQQHLMWNFESDACRTCFVLDDMSFLWVFGFNVEKFGTALHSVVSDSCLFNGVHFEMGAGVGYATTSSVCFDLEHATNFTADTIRISGADPQKVVYAHGASAAQVSYEIRNASGYVRIDDDNRSHDFKGDSGGVVDTTVRQVVAPVLPTSFSFPDPAPIKVIGPDGRYLAMGAQNNDQAQLITRAGTSQTGAAVRVLNSSDAEVFSVTPAGQVVVNNGPKIIAGASSPEGAVIAPIGSLFLRSDGGTNTSLYIKQSGTSNTGWAAVTP